MEKAKSKKIKVYSGKEVPRGKLEKIRSKPGQSSAGKYKGLKKSQFAGPEGTFPINTKARARNALARAHFAANPSAIKAKVHAKYPSIGKKKK